MKNNDTNRTNKTSKATTNKASKANNTTTTIKNEVENMKTTTTTTNAIETKQAEINQTVEPSIIPFIKCMEKLFNHLNKKLFNNELDRPVITVQTDSKNRSYGWCTTWKAWKIKTSETIDTNSKEFAESGYYEINITAEHTGRPFDNVACTMLHEMVHLYNIKHNIKDTSRNGTFHNKKFKETAESHGLTVTQTEKYGFSHTELNENGKKAVDTFKDGDDFKLYRYTPVKGKVTREKSHSIKYVCPVCGMTVRATKEVNIKCADCDEYMIPDYEL